MTEDFSLNSGEGYNRLPITRPILIETTGRIEGDDDGYRDVPVEDDGERVIALSEEDGLDLRPIYDGVDPIDGSKNDSANLPGGIDGKMFVRESVAIGLRAFANYLRERHGESVKPIIIDTFRSYKRQAAGFSGLLDKALGGNRQPNVEEMFKAGRKADGTFSYVRANPNAPELASFMSDIEASGEIGQDLRLLSEKLGSSFETVLLEYTTFCVNLRIRQRLGLSLDIENPYNSDQTGDVIFENNAHAGAAAVDMFLGVDGKIASSLAPYDSMGPWAAKEALEDDANFEGYKREAETDPELSGFLQRLGISATTLTRDQWEFAKEANRVLHHPTNRMGATYYSAANPQNGGENWHIEFGNVIWDPANSGQVIHQAPSSSRHWNSGNPGHALQRMPAGTAVAVWGGTEAHRQLGLI